MPEAMDIKESVVSEPTSPQIAAATQREAGSLVRMEKLIGTVLLVGVLVSTAIVAFGGVVYLVRHSSSPVHYRIFRGEPSDLRTLQGISDDLATFSGRGIIQLGLMLLVAVQVVRVVLTGVLFGMNRDRVFVVVSTLVLVLLLYGLFWESAVAH
jgi:uncharacterized membrane protein